MSFKRFTLPFKNKKGLTVPGVIMTVILSSIGIIMISWIFMKFQSIYIERRMNTLANNIGDVIAENGQLTSEMQTVLYEDLTFLVKFGGGYKISYQTFNYSNPGAKTSLGVSTSGAKVSPFTVPSGNILRVTIKTDSSPLDKFTNALLRKSGSIGIRGTSSHKVD